MFFRKKEKQDKSESNTKHLDEAGADVNWKEKDDAYWKSVLTPLQYNVTRNAGTEYAGTGHYSEYDGEGIFCCSNCGNELFDAKTKYNSGTGWPSFYDCYNSDSVELKEDSTMFMKRVEVLCKRCNAHLGHVFDDGPNPTGKRYCMNSVSLYMPEKPTK